MTKSTGPKRLQSLLFLENATFEAGDVFLSEAKFFGDCPNQLRKVHSVLDREKPREKPKIIEIPRFIPRRIGKRDDLLGRDFVQTVAATRRSSGRSSNSGYARRTGRCSTGK